MARNVEVLRSNQFHGSSFVKTSRGSVKIRSKMTSGSDHSRKIRRSGRKQVALFCMWLKIYMYIRYKFLKWPRSPLPLVKIHDALR